ncbi:MAG TPA: recombinase family protein [Candidatus Hydrogenedentes bacterium]|nr:recombinase family protein [Candidatus Hydrogenedentota bacterium]
MHEDNRLEESVPPARAVIYARMSTEHQQYSTENQSDVIREYASKHNMEIVRTYADEGKSGLRLDGRDSLKRLIEDVQSGHVDFEAILVYDVSRWGRFQDADESAYYEYLCRRAGITVIYCAEQFENDGSPVSTIVKGVKRAMAGEYSRELSSKVFKGQCRLIQLGYRQGGHAGFGLRRMLIDQQGNPKGELHFGEMKSIQTDRVILVPGPPEELAVVERIFTEFVHEQKPESEIADALNARGIETDLGRLWTKSTVNQVLTNEKYIGNNVYNRVSFKLKKKRVRNPEEMWIRADGVYDPIVEPALFWAAREIILERARTFSNDELIQGLKGLLEKTGWLSSVIIDECDVLPSSSVYRHRFGSLLRAYQLVGYEPDRDFEYLETNRRLREMYPRVVEDVVARMAETGGTVVRDNETDLFAVNGEFTVSVIIARCQRTPAGAYRWNIRLDRVLRPDITVAVRMDEINESAMDYYLLPTVDMALPKLRLAEQNGIYFDAYRFDTLDYLYGMARRARVEVA